MLLAAPASAQGKARPRAEPSTIRAVSSDDIEVRQSALNALNDADSATIPASLAPKLLDIVQRSENTALRESALQLLGHIGPRAYSKRAQRLLVSYLDLRKKAPPGRVRGWAAWSLGKIGAPVKEVGLTLLGMTGPYDDFTRAAALEGFVELGGDVPGFLRLSLANLEPGHLRATVIQLLAAFPPNEGGLTMAEARRLLAQAHRTEREPLTFVIAQAIPATERGARQLGELLSTSTSYFERRILLKRLEELGPIGAPAGPALCALLREPDASIFAVSDALIAIGPSTETACAAIALRDRFPTENSYTVAKTAAHLGQPGEAMLIWGLKHQSADVRSASLIAISDMKPPPVTAYADVRRLTRDPTPYAAPTAIRALAAYGPRAHRHLVELFRSAPDDDRAAAAQYLGGDDWSLLFGAIADDSPQVRAAVHRRLSKLALHPRKVIPHFFDGQRFWHTLPELVEPFGAEGAAVVVELLKHDDEKVREAAASTLGSIRLLPDESVRALELALDDSSEDVRSWAAWSLGHFGAHGRVAAASLRSALLDPSHRVREHAATSLGLVGAVEAEGDLLEMLANGTETLTRVGVVKGLGALGTPGARAALAAALGTEKNNYVRGEIARSLGASQIDAAGREALRVALDDDDVDVRVAAARSLLRVGTTDDRLRAQAIVDKDGGLRFIKMPDL